MEKEYLKSKIIKFAHKNGWIQVDYQKPNSMLSIANSVGQEIKLNIYLTTMTVAVISPDTIGRKQEFYYGVDPKSINAFLIRVAP